MALASPALPSSDRPPIVSSSNVLLLRIATVVACFAPVLSLAQSDRSARIEEHLREVEGGFGHKYDAAVNALLVIEPSTVDADVRKRVTRAFREQLLNGRSHDKGPAVRGVVHWAGKYSGPVLIEAIQQSQMKVDPALFEAIVEVDSADGAEAVAGLFGNFFNHDAAVECLSQMGATAEPCAINVAKSQQ